MKRSGTPWSLLTLATLTWVCFSGEESQRAGAGVLPQLAPDAMLVKQIAELPENTWLKLPLPKIVKKNGYPSKRDYQSKWGAPVATRSYCNVMAWAPDRKRVLYCGAGHNTHGKDDVWEYDLASNTWVCLLEPHPAFPYYKKEREAELIAFAKKNAKYENGIYLATNGGPIRPIHTWDALCYDEERKLLLWLDPVQGHFSAKRRMPYITKALGQSYKEWDQTRVAKRNFIYGFSTAKHQWDDVQTGVLGGEGAVMLYIPDKKSIFINTGNRCYSPGTACSLYNPQTKKLTQLSIKGKAPYAASGDYDPHTKSVVCVTNRKSKTNPDAFLTYIYSFEKDEWRTHESPAGGREVSCMFFYDSVARKFVLYTNTRAKPDDPHLWLYDVKTAKWTPKGDAKGDLPPAKSKTIGYYDAAHNVNVLFPGKGPAYVYRAKMADATQTANK